MMYPVRSLEVSLDFGLGALPVGRLASRDQIIYFEYFDDFIENGLEISPLRLPLKKGLYELPIRPFEGLPGAFNDSLPDGWGRLLFDRSMRSKGIFPMDITPLDRLAHVGLSGMGALVYQPDFTSEEGMDFIDLDELAEQTVRVLEGDSEDVIEELLALNGSSAGARPKVLVGVDAERRFISYGIKKLDDKLEDWLIKFPNSRDGADAGAIEYVYAQMAKDAGITIPDVHLFPSKYGGGYFGVKRFDRQGTKRLHMHTLSGILHHDFRTPSLDYEDLLNLTGFLTKNVSDVEQNYRLAVFNVLAHNRDDHTKNFSFLMDENGKWQASPGYDLTFSNGPGGEQSMLVMGEGSHPTISQLIKLGQVANLSKGLINNIIEQTRDAISQWDALSGTYGVSKSNQQFISRRLLI